MLAAFAAPAAAQPPRSRIASDPDALRLANPWHWEEDRSPLTPTLRPGIRFHVSVVMDADAVITGQRRYPDTSASARRGELGPVREGGCNPRTIPASPPCWAARAR